MKDRSNPPGFEGVARVLPCRSLPPQYEPNARGPVSAGSAQELSFRALGDAGKRPKDAPLRPAPKT
jgi:hypothetical protein